MRYQLVETTRTRAFITALLLAFALFTSANVGCATLLGNGRFNAADIRFELNRASGPTFSRGTTQTLKAYQIPPKSSLEQLEELQKKLDENPTPELVYSFIETSYIRARTLETRRPLVAKRLYLYAAIYAYHYLFNPSLNAQYDSVFNAELVDVVCLYNGACERFLHLELANADANDFPFRPGRLRDVKLDEFDYPLYTELQRCSWRKEELESFQLVTDCPVSELSFDCRRSGLGVPIVAKRRVAAEYDRPEEEYYPNGLRFPLTALIEPNPSLPLRKLPAIDSNARFESPMEEEALATVKLYDPFQNDSLKIYGRDTLLETDVTTPLAYFLNEKSPLSSKAAKKGLLRPDEMFETTIPSGVESRERTLQGLYMFEPYDPSKIPVVMTHGLGSSPTTWMEMYNALRNASEIQNAYQFWFYFYPTGQPFWASAAQLRLELLRLRQELDPDAVESALDWTVLVGHSMGGLISRMQVQSSEDKIWKRISSTPFEQIDLDDETRADLQAWFFFEPNPSIKRVVTIATPFEGSDFANNFTQWIADRAIALPQKVTRVLENMTQQSKGQINDVRLLETNTSVDSLSPKCPIFSALDECEIPPDGTGMNG